MANTDKELRIKDGFSNVLDKYIQKLSASVAEEEKADRSLESLINRRNELANAYKSGNYATNMFQEMSALDQEIEAETERIQEEFDKVFNKAPTDWAAKFRAASDGVKGFVSNLLGLNKSNPALDGVTKRIRGMVLYMFTARRLLRYMRDAIQYAPDDVAKPIQDLKSSISGLFNGTMVSALAGLSGGIERLNKAFQSESGQKFARGLETIARFAGGVFSYAFDKAALLVEWLGDHFAVAASIAAVMAARTGAKFLVMGMSFLFAHAQLILIIGAIALAAFAINSLVKHLTGAAITVEDVFGVIGQGIGWLYATGYNAVADGWNIIASFVEFFANVWNDPIASIGHLFFDLGDTIVGMVETAAKAIDGLLGTNYSGAVTGFRDKIQDFADGLLGDKSFKLNRMEKLDNATIMESFGGKARDLAGSLSDFNLQNTVAQELKDISKNTGSIAKAVTEEDLKALVDMAERQFVSNVNLTSQTPVINITGANTGNTAADRKSLADALAKVLMEMAASSGSVSGVTYSEG